MVRVIPGYGGLYSATGGGEIYSYYGRGRVLKPCLSSSGYLQVGLTKDKVTVSSHIHRIVAELFVPGYFGGAVVNHIDEDKTNNNYSNLEWVSREYNTQYSNSSHWLVVFPCGKVEAVCNLKKFCRENNLNPSHMYQVAKGICSHHKQFKCRRI